MQVVLNSGDVLAALCRDAKKWGIYASGLRVESDADLEELKKAAPWLETLSVGDRVYATTTMGFIYLLFDTKEEMEALFEATVGDDGPMELNPYTGPRTVYCLTCDPSGQLLNENT